MTALKWVLIVYFTFIVFFQVYHAAERKDPGPTGPSSKAISAVLHIGLIYWILEVWS